MQKVIVLDFGGQYAQLLVRRVRSFGVYSTLVDYDISAKAIKEDKDEIIGIIFSGGPYSAYAKNALKVDKEIFNLNIPILGVCYGMQTTCQQLGGKVAPGKKKEYGQVILYSNPAKCPILKGWTKAEQVYMSHNDKVVKIPAGFETVGCSDLTENCVVQNKKKNIYLTQFHPEVLHTLKGNTLIKNFLYDVCKAEHKWTIKNQIQQAVDQIRKQVGKEKVICALSGGVDSSVTAALLHKAIGKQLTCIFVDHGLLRKDEGKLVEQAFKKNFKDIKFIKVNAQKLFLKKLKGVTDPESKRKIIGKTFIDVFKANAKNIKNLKFLAQGTIYPDVIESGSKVAHVIKSHHNVGGLPKDLNLKLVEPLRMLFKDEVRTLGVKLGLPEAFINRQPFPGPGLGVRIIGEITEQKIRLVQEADAIVREEFEKAGISKDLWQYFAILPDVKTVGCKGDLRSYENLVVIRAVKSVDVMTASVAEIPYSVLAKVSSRITNEVDGINRVAYDITSKPPGTIEWE